MCQFMHLMTCVTVYDTGYYVGHGTRLKQDTPTDTVDTHCF